MVIKRRVPRSPAATLRSVLRGLGIGTLVLTGIATSGVVLSTLRQAADLDYQLVVLSDACLDMDRGPPGPHREDLPPPADVRPTSDWQP